MRFRVPSIGLTLPALLALAPALVAQQADTTAKKNSSPLGVFTDTAQKYGLLPRHFTISVGGFLPSISSKAQLSTSTVPGTEIPLENTLGLKKSYQSLDLQATIRIAKKQAITLGYFGFSRSGSRTLADSIVFGDSVYEAGATIDAGTKFYYYGLTYRYYFYNRPTWDFGAGLGIDAFNISAHLGIQASIGGGSDSLKKSGGFTAPAPMLGIYGDWQFADRFYLRGQLQYLYIANVASYGGAVSDDRLAIDWFPFHNYGIGLMYHFVGLRVTKFFDNGDNLTFKYYVQGPALYLTAAF